MMDESDYGPPPAPLVEKPVAVSASEVAVADPAVSEKAAEPEPVKEVTANAFEALDPVKFEQNTYLVAFSQHDLIGSATALAKQLPSTGKVVLRGYPDRPGRYDYNDWLCRERAKAVQRLIVESGFAEDRVVIDSPKDFKVGDRFGSVLILIPKLEKELAEVTDSSPAPATATGTAAEPIGTPGPM